MRATSALLPVATAVLLLTGCERPRPTRRPSADVTVSAAPGGDAKTRDLDIAFYEQRLREDPESALDRSRLAQLYLSRARETGSYNDIERAERLARQSLAVRESHNAGTYMLLASALLAKHDFAGALAAARRLNVLDPESPVARGLLGEVLLEIGSYDEAGAIFRALEPSSKELAVAPRLVRWYELTGHLAQARSLARYASVRARTEGALSREQIAWFHLRVGELALKAGDAHEADSVFALALSIFPDDYRVYAAAARAAALRGRWRDAIAAGEKSVATQLDPATLGVLSDAWSALGDTAQAASYARAMTASALAQPGAIHRAWGLFLVDRHRDVKDVLARVRREQRTRRDVYGNDLLAWSLHALGREREAWAAARRAVAQGTEDAQLWYHAAEIAHAAGSDTEARALADRAAALNPRFSPSGPARLAALRVALGGDTRTQAPLPAARATGGR